MPSPTSPLPCRPPSLLRRLLLNPLLSLPLRQWPSRLPSLPFSRHRWLRSLTKKRPRRCPCWIWRARPTRCPCRRCMHRSCPRWRCRRWTMPCRPVRCLPRGRTVSRRATTLPASPGRCPKAICASRWKASWTTPAIARPTCLWPIWPPCTATRSGRRIPCGMRTSEVSRTTCWATAPSRPRTRTSPPASRPIWMPGPMPWRASLRTSILCWASCLTVTSWR